MKVYIYTLEDPITKEIRYVGKTNNIKLRFNCHVSNRKINTHCHSWIRSLIRKDMLPIMQIIDTCNNNDWQWVEQYWISQIKAWGFNLTNHTIGGEGSSGRKQPLSEIQKRIKAIKGKKRTFEQKQKISKALKDRSLCTTHKNNVSIGLKKYYKDNGHPLKGVKKEFYPRKIDEKKVLEIRKFLLQGYTTRKLAEMFDISKGTIQDIKIGKTWQHIGTFKIIGRPGKNKKIQKYGENYVWK